MRIANVLYTVRRRTVVLAIIVGLSIWGGTIWLQRAIENRLTVENHSGQPISLVKIGVYGSPSSVMFQNMLDDGNGSVPFVVHGDGGFYVHGHLEDGTNIKGGYYGYVTNGMYGEHAHFVIKQGGGLDFSQGRE